MVYLVLYTLYYNVLYYTIYMPYHIACTSPVTARHEVKAKKCTGIMAKKHGKHTRNEIALISE